MMNTFIFRKTILFWIVFFMVNFELSGQEWTWMKGANTINSAGVYGTQGTASPSNLSGSREGAATWTDLSGNLWMYGGNGFCSFSYGRLNDLWKFDPSSNQWTWVNGPDNVNVFSNHGSLGTASVTNTPGARAYCATWTDNSGDLWLFGGFGYDDFGNLGDLNDLWKYNISGNVWTWVGGSNSINQNGAYGTLGVSSTTNIPGSRRSPSAWKDNSGNLWLFGGFGFPASGGSESGMNDLWKYNISGNTWQWVHGSSSIDQAGTYGTQGTANTSNTPGTRYGTTSWKDNSGNLWMFAGYGFGSTAQGHLNDVWKFNTSTNQWTWMKGSTQIAQISVFGTQTIPSAITTPGGRYYSAGWSDAHGNLYVSGGNGISTYSLSVQNLNDTWKYDVNLNQWSWLRGQYYEIIGNYGTQGTTATTNDPGSGYLRMSWKDNSGNFWLFGGNAYDAVGNYGVMSDLWKMNACLPPAPIGVSTFSNQNACTGVSATLSAVSNTNSVSWYSAPTGGTALTTGTNYITPVLSSGTAATTSYTYYASATNTCGNSSVRTPIIVTSNNINPTVTTGPTQFTVAHYIGNGQTPNSSWSPWTYTFSDPLPVGAIITGVGISCDAVDQGWGGTGAGLDIRLAGTRVAIPILYHYNQTFNLGATDPFANYNYGGSNTFEMYFVGWGGWQAFMTNATLTFSYQTKTPASITACQNSSLTLKGYGAVSYTWTGGVLDNVPFALSSTQIYTVTGANIYGCVNTATQLVNVNPSPTVAVSGNTAICIGSTLSQTASVSGTSHTFSWSTGASTSTISTTPTISTTYIATASNTLTGCSHAMPRKVLVNSLPSVSVTSGNSTICSGKSVSLSVSSSTYAYGLNFDGTDDYLESNADITELGQADFSFEVWIKTTSNSQGIFVSNNSDNVWDPNEKAFYIDANGVLGFVGYSNYYILGVSAVNDGNWHHLAVVWDYNTGTSGTGKIYVDGLDNTLSSNYTANMNNNTANTFKFGMPNYGEVSNFFNGTMDDIRIWNTARTPSQISSNMNSCLTGNEFGLVAYYKMEEGTGSNIISDLTINDHHATLSNMNTSSAWVNGRSNCASSISGYVWMPGSLSTQTVNVSPASGTIYTVSVTNNNSCVGTSTKSITVNPSPTITVNSGALCVGNSFTMTPAGAATYSISGGNTIVSPTITTNYSVSGTSALGCTSSNTAIATVTVNSLPILSITGQSAVCSGASITQSVSGASSYSWSTGATGATIAVSPSVNTTYSVVGTNSVTGCSNSSLRSIVVGNIPVITVNSGNICQGQIFTLVPNGAATYTFANSTGTVLSTVSPSSNTSYFVSGTSSLGCVSTSSAISNVVVNSAPVISVNSGAVCAGKVFTMVPSGANTYTFSNGSSTVIPSATTNYSVSGTTILGCVSLVPGIASVTVNPIPVVAASNGTVCNGSTYTIQPSGASTYTFNSTSGLTSSLVAPSTNANYSVTGTSSAGCVASNTAVITVTVIALPSISVNSSTVCSGSVFTMTPSGASSYTFSNGSSTVIPVSNVSYSVLGTSSVGCVSAMPAVANVTLLASPVVSVNSGAICIGKTFTLIPSGAQTYSYSGNSSTVSPTTNSTYSVTGTNSLGCVSTNVAVANVIVNSLPQLSINSATSICLGEATNLIVTGASTFTWNTGASGPILSVSPSTSTSYTVNGTNSNLCVNSLTFVLTVNTLPTITVNSGTVCPNSSFTLIPSGALTYTFSSGSTIVSPSSTSSYSVSGTNVNGCVSSVPAVSTVSVINTISLAVSGSNVICAGQTASLIATGANTYSWNTGATSQSIAPSPSVNAMYSVIGFDGSCKDSTIFFIQVNSLPVIQLNASSLTMCSGETATLSASGANSYTWNTQAHTNKLIINPLSSTSYSVIGTGANGCENSAVTTVTVNECTGISSLNDLFSEIKIYPNPTSGKFIIHCNYPLKMKLSNALGQVVLEKDIVSGENEITLLDQSNGMYFVDLIANQQIQTFKLIKQ